MNVPISLSLLQRQQVIEPSYATQIINHTNIPLTSIGNYGERSDTPYDNIPFRDVSDASDGSLELWWIGIGWNRNDHLDVISRGTGFELRSSFYRVLYTRVGVSFNHRFDPNQRLHLLPMQTSQKFLSWHSTNKNLHGYLTGKTLTQTRRRAEWRRWSDHFQIFVDKLVSQL